jgi:hypothetical protein
MTATSQVCPKTSAMSLRSRRAVAPASSSASTTIFADTMCSALANRSSEETSALRQHGLVMDSLASSSFTDAVMAMGRSCHG